VRYLTLAEAIAVAGVVTDIDPAVLVRLEGLALLDSALHAPQAGFGDVELYPEFTDKAAVLCLRIARNHPLPDGNKRLAWQCLTLFCELNGYELRIPTEEAVSTVLDVAAGVLDEEAMSAWLVEKIKRREPER
jgi:death on curing protein